MVNVVYPVAAEFFEIQPDLMARAEEGRVGLKLFPRVTRDTSMVRWAQKDNSYGLQKWRGINGKPSRVVRTGTNTFTYESGVYGEVAFVDEREVLNRSVTGHPDIPIPVGDLVQECDDLLLSREFDRMEANVWSLLSTGTLTIPQKGSAGVTIYQDVYPIQTYTATIPWSSLSTATPLIDMQNVQQKQVGTSAKFDSTSTNYINQVQANRLLNNQNASDFGGRRSQYGATINNVMGFNDYFRGQNLPGIGIYDDGYQLSNISGPDTNPSVNFTKFIANGVGILVGKRPGNSPVGEMQMTKNTLNPGYAPGPARILRDYFMGVNAPKETPGRIEVERGWFGGPTILFPTSVVAMAI